MKIKLFATLLFALPIYGHAMPVELITNGNFETGTLNGWLASSSNPDIGGFDTGWNVASAAVLGGGIRIDKPIDTYAAYESFDGSGPKTRTLSQSFVIPDHVSSGVLSFWDTWYVTTFHGGTLPRIFDASLIAGVDDLNVYHLSTRNAQPLPFALQSLDVTGFLQAHGGETAQLNFITTIPEYGTGPGVFGLDDVSIVVNASEPATLALISISLFALSFTRAWKVRCRLCTR